MFEQLLAIHSTRIFSYCEGHRYGALLYTWKAIPFSQTATTGAPGTWSCSDIFSQRVVTPRKASIRSSHGSNSVRPSCFLAPEQILSCSASALFSLLTKDTCAYLKIDKSQINVLISVPLLFGTHVLIAIRVCSLYSQFSFSLLTPTARSYNGE
jgi:hypothetical protein